MQLTATILSSVAALAGTAAAQAQAPHAAFDLRFPIPTAPPRPLAVRGSRTQAPAASISECYKSLEDVYLTMPTPGPALVKWAGDNLFKATDGGLCSATMPESLSADYKSYVPRLASWYAGASSTAEAVMAQCTELAEQMPAEGAGGMPVVSCTANPTIFWVNEQGKTRAEEQTVPPELRGGKAPAATAGQTPASSAAGSASAAATGSSSGAAPAKASGTSPAAASGTSPVAASGGSALRSVGLGMFAGAVAFAAVLI